ncbi:MAG: hypothetical protein WCW13_02150 [archaeon]
MNLSPWLLSFKVGWDTHFFTFDPETKKRILAKFEHMKQPLLSRGLHSTRFCVEEVGQYRIAFYLNEETRTKEIHFVDTHKQYEKWYKSID